LDHAACWIKKCCIRNFYQYNNIVIAAANTGKLATNKNAVIKIDHVNKGISNNRKFNARILKIVTIKFIALINDDNPANM